jgi:competence protein ComEA
MAKMNQFRIKDLFFFSKRERSGIYTLAILVGLLLLVRFNMHKLASNNETTIDPEFVSEINTFFREPSNSGNVSDTTEIESIQNPTASFPQLFFFDPNQISVRGWRDLGLSDRQIKVIMRFKNAGGKFYRKRDLLKIYGINTIDYERLKHYIFIEKEQAPSAVAPKSESQEIPVIEINTADTFQLALLKGIGPVYARRICKYRDLVGGFYCLEQLTEVYGITKDLLEQIEPSIHIDTGQIRSINVNKADFGSLIRHPYINEYQIRSILSYRKFKGEIDHTEALFQEQVLDSGTYIRLKPYLTVD